LEARAAKTGWTVIPGEEVKTGDQGEVIGLFLSEEIPRGLPFADTLAAIHEQGGVVYLPHPFDRMHSIPDAATLRRHLDEIDVFEVYNARLLFEGYNEESLRFAGKYNLTMGAGSDAHVLQGVGTGALRMREFHDRDEFLLKRRPQAAEVQEGVAFYGRAGQALLKSLQRLHVDPLAVYGTNCLKFAVQEEDEARPWPERELHIVQPKLIVVMGEDALRFLNELEFPLADTLEPKVGELQRFTPTIEALLVPDIDASLDEQPAKTRFWNAFKQLDPWSAAIPPY